MDYKKLLQKLFYDKSGKFVIVQLPNIPLVIWGAATVTGKISDGLLQTTSGLVAFISILIWSGMEVYSGSTLFRRLFGGIVAIIVLFNKF